MESLLWRPWFTIGPAGWWWVALRLSTRCIYFFTSRALSLLWSATCVVLILKIFRTTFSSLVLGCALFLRPLPGRTFALSWHRAIGGWLCMPFSPSSWTMLGWSVHCGVSDMAATRCSGLHALGCVLSLPSGSWWEWWVTLIIIIIIIIIT